MKKSYTQVTWKPGDKPLATQTDVKKLKRMSERSINTAAWEDEDNKPLTKEELSKFRPVRTPKKIDVKAIREELHVSQDEFARYFGVNVRTIQDWEQHRHEPGHTARNFLIVIAREPRAVQRALQKGLLL